ncbi:CHA4 activatory protein, putative [Talaromyces stipitatus ATCC 10500]|uniref:CHA4 activatory protein, putative n=1 Tax=Talaromyces stipitatus (strain ATCC 10500 / CBS 375.48 / QM 6759 / NRRL 1006) TaxID=441959 RepID=B8M4K3_TALSN|nr:CHA4 activatory protein, putative [Talaromyces stipitatus ATCC 10500]EED19198.1 CHA4 activatory protein, putative [Talaromyces stipitatus ATCC 10500]
MGSPDIPSPVATRAKGRKYGFACLSCRRKKIKCDGSKPICINCNKSKESCVYRDNPAFVGYLAEELRKSKIRVQELETVIKELLILDSESRHLRIAALVSEMERQRSSPSPGSSTLLESDESHAKLSVSYGGSVEYNIDENGRQQYFGATSRFHTLSEASEHLENVLDTTTEQEYSDIEEYHRKWHLSNSRWQASWEKQAHDNIPKYTDVDASLCSQLLDVYWTWQGPLHNYVYRRCFFRDMAIGGPYFSLFLLNVMFAHAMRHMPEEDPRFKPFERGEFFMKRAMLLLLDEMKESKPKIPTIQGLLILGGRQCAVGKSSEGWLYTGMAIRMITDLGLHLRKGRNAMLKEYEPDDLEVRKRLYLSCYAWDKCDTVLLKITPDAG